MIRLEEMYKTERSKPIAGIVTFSSTDLLLMMASFPHFHIDTHLGWFGKTASHPSVRFQSLTYTGAFKELNEMLAAFGTLLFDTRRIYQSFQKGLSGSYALPDYDGLMIEGYHTSERDDYSKRPTSAFKTLIAQPFIKMEEVHD